MSHVTCSCICKYINTVANSVMLQLYLRHDFYNVIFKINNKFCSLRVSCTPPPTNNSG